ncbi:MAG: glycosyltransferase [Flavobacteriales bacterium]|nr:glycosyltransferase [Flavobacteriales bacterium]
MSKHKPSYNSPDISIVIPCYNDGIYLAELISSIPDSIPGKIIEVLIVDDGSTDTYTLKVLDEFSARYQVIHQSNQGVSTARNTGIRASSAQYILPVDTDNKLTTRLIDEAICLLNENPDIDIVYSDAYLFGSESGERITGDYNLSRLKLGNYIDTCAVFRREVWERNSGYDEKLNRYTYEDWEFWLQASANGFKFYYINKPLYYYRVKKATRNDAGLDPEKRKWIVGYIVDKHRSLFADDFPEILASLHGIVALWEGPNRLKWEEDREKIKDEFSLEKNKIIAQYESAIVKLEKAFEEKTEQSRKLFQQELENERAIANEKIKERNAEIEKIKNESAQQLTRLNHELAFEKTTASNQQIVIRKFEERIRSMEGTRTWRARMAYYKLRNTLKQPKRNKWRIPGWGLIRKILFFTLGKGRIMTRRLLKKIFKSIYLWLEEFPVRIVPVSQLPYLAVPSDPYGQWRLLNAPREAEYKQYKKHLDSFSYKPLISVLLPVYNTPIHFLKACINSVTGQLYENWELCIADDASTDPEVKKVLDEYTSNDYRIRITYRKENGHISQSSNSALAMTSGEYTLLLDHDDELSHDCLYQIVQLLNKQPELDLIYSDEDKIDENGTHSMPHFKPQWCPDSFLSRNYIGHVVVCRTSILKDIGGFRVGFEGSQDYDMLLRFTEQTDHIGHIPKILYHWRIHAASTAGIEDAKPYAYEAARKAITEACARRNEPADVHFISTLRGYYAPRYQIQNTPKVSIIIPTKDQAHILDTALKSIFELSTWKNFEVIVVSNNSSEKSLYQLFNQYTRLHPAQFKWIACDVLFNFSLLMNEGVKHANGDFLLLLNNDIEIITPDWIEAMIEQAQRKSVGAVGAKLLYYNGTVQHGGVVVGLGGVAGHAFVGLHRDDPGYFNYLQCVNNFSAVTAACLMVDKKKYLAIQGFDERFEIEFNDVDFCLRLREVGYHNVYLPQVELFHYESLTRGHPHLSKASYERHVRELNLFKKHWQHIIDDDPCYSPNLTRGSHDFALAL